MSSIVYDLGALKLADKAQSNAIDWASDTIKVMLVNGSYTPDKTAANLTAIAANELSGTNYTGGFNGSGRKSLSGKAVAQDDSLTGVRYKAYSLTWTAINAGTARYAVIIKEVTNDAGSIPIACLDLGTGSNTITNGGDLTINWNGASTGSTADSVFTLTT